VLRGLVIITRRACFIVLEKRRGTLSKRAGVLFAGIAKPPAGGVLTGGLGVASCLLFLALVARACFSNVSPH